MCRYHIEIIVHVQKRPCKNNCTFLKVLNVECTYVKETINYYLIGMLSFPSKNTFSVTKNDHDFIFIYLISWKMPHVEKIKIVKIGENQEKRGYKNLNPLRFTPFHCDKFADTISPTNLFVTKNVLTDGITTTFFRWWADSKFCIFVYIFIS